MTKWRFQRTNDAIKIWKDGQPYFNEPVSVDPEVWKTLAERYKDRPGFDIFEALTYYHETSISEFDLGEEPT